MKNFKLVNVGTLIVLAFALPKLAVANPVPAPDTLKFEQTDARVQDVLTHMLTALGADDLAKVQDRSKSGRFITKVEGKEAVGTLLTIEAGPAKRSDQLMLLDHSIRHIIDGTHSWVSDSNGKLRPLSGPSLQSDLAQAVFNPELHLLDTGVAVALLGTTTVDSIGKVYVLKVQFKGAYPELWYVSATNYIIIERGQPVRGLILWMRYSDFRKVDGVTYPFKVSVTGPQNFSIVYEAIRHNIHPDPKTFEPS
jgi:hypothetical protein